MIWSKSVIYPRLEQARAKECSNKLGRKDEKLHEKKDSTNFPLSKSINAISDEKNVNWKFISEPPQDVLTS